MNKFNLKSILIGALIGIISTVSVFFLIGDIDMEAEAAASRNKTVVAHEDDLVDELVRRSQESNLGLEVIDIVCVTDLANQYMQGIGAIGDQITELEGE